MYFFKMRTLIIENYYDIFGYFKELSCYFYHDKLFIGLLKWKTLDAFFFKQVEVEE